MRCGGKALEIPFTLTFGDVSAGRTVVCEDSFRAITIAVNAGRADRALRAAASDPIVLSRVHRVNQAPAGKVAVIDAVPSRVT